MQREADSFPASRRHQLIFTCLPACSASVRMNWSVGVLANLLWRLGRLIRDARVVVLSRKDYECQEVMALAESDVLDGVEFISRPLEGMMDVLAGTGAACEQLIHVSMGAALLPAGTVDVLIARHRAGQAGCTLLGGVPQEASVQVYQAEVGRCAVRRSAARVARGEKSKPWPALILEAAELQERKIVQVPLSHVMALPGMQIPVTFDVVTRPGAMRFERIVREAGAWIELNEQARPRTARDTAPGSSENLLTRWRRELARELRDERWPSIARCPAPDSRPRILYVSYSVAFSGAEEALCQAIARLDSSRFSLHALLGADGIFAERLRELGVNVVIAGMRFCESSLESFRRLHRIFLDVAPDIVHFNAFSGEPAVVVAKMLSCTCVFHFRVNALPLQQIELLLQMDHVVAVSAYVRQLALQAGVGERQLTTLYDPIDTDAFCPVPEDARVAARRALDLDPTVFTVLMIARLERRKRHDVLIKAIACLDDLPIQCLLVGESNGDLTYEQEIRSLAELPGIRGRVLFRGFSPDVRALEIAADLAVLCSDEEPLGVFVLECMALAVPVIAGESSGAAEIIGRDGKAGLLARTGDPAHLAECLRWMITHPVERALLAEEGRKRCVRMCGRGNSGLEQVYEALCVARSARIPLVTETAFCGAPGLA